MTFLGESTKLTKQKKLMRTFFFSLLIVGSLSAPRTVMGATAAESIANATKKLSESGGYSWTSLRSGNPFWMGEVKGKVRKDGGALVSLPSRDSSYLTAFLDGKSAAETQEGWQSLSELENAEGFGRFLGFSLRSYKVPVAELTAAVLIAEKIEGSEGVYKSQLKADGVKKLLSFGRPGEGPEVMDPSGSIKITIKDESITSYELTLNGSMSFNGNDFDINRSSKVTLSGLGQAEFEFPEKAKAKLKK